MDALSNRTKVMYCSCVSAYLVRAAFTPPSTSLKPMMAGFWMSHMDPLRSMMITLYTFVFSIFCSISSFVLV